MSRRIVYLSAAIVVALLIVWGLGSGHATTTVTASASGTAEATADSALVRVAFTGDPAILKTALHNVGVAPAALSAGRLRTTPEASYRVYSIAVQPAQAEPLMRALAAVPGVRRASYALQAKNRSQAEQQAYAAAVAAAKTRAQALAAASGLRLGRLISVKATGGARARPAIGTAPLQVRASVSVTYAAS